jgi:oleandomycin transport system ATP-binding protein
VKVHLPDKNKGCVPVDSIAIEVRGLKKYFGDVKALDGVDFVVRQGTVFGLLGPNGAGKTTAIRVLSTLLLPDEGTASVGGYDVATAPKKVRRLIGLTGQNAAVDELLPGFENLYMIGRLIGMNVKDSKDRATELLEHFDLSDAAKKTVKTYSGGMRRRLDLAASLVGRPPFLYLDEPTTGLDPRSRLDLWDMIRGLVAQGTTVLLTTQYLDEADHLSDEIVVIDHGKVIAAGTPVQLKSQVGDQVLEARPTNEMDIEATRKILASVVGEKESIHSDGQLVSVRAEDRSVLSKAIAALDEEGIEVDDLGLRRPSLDEVFLALTGHVAEEDESEDKEGSKA